MDRIVIKLNSSSTLIWMHQIMEVKCSSECGLKVKIEFFCADNSFFTLSNIENSSYNVDCGQRCWNGVFHHHPCKQCWFEWMNLVHQHRVWCPFYDEIPWSTKMTKILLLARCFVCWLVVRRQFLIEIEHTLSYRSLGMRNAMVINRNSIHSLFYQIEFDLNTFASCRHHDHDPNRCPNQSILDWCTLLQVYRLNGHHRPLGVLVQHPRLIYTNRPYKPTKTIVATSEDWANTLNPGRFPPVLRNNFDP